MMIYAMDGIILYKPYLSVVTAAHGQIQSHAYPYALGVGSQK